jgi:lipopolysaccharide export system ATP-binding protein
VSRMAGLERPPSARLDRPVATLRVESLVKRYGGRCVVDHVSLAVSPREIVGLLGHNGAGKTTTFYMIIGLVRPDAGEIWNGSRRITDAPVDVRVRGGLGYLAQEASVFRRLTVEENILIILERHGLGPDERRARTDRLLAEFHLEGVRRQPAWTLSGGERRRVEIARALALEPTFLLLDEPFTGIDPRSVQELQRTVRYLRERGLGLIITDHNVRDTLAITDRVEIIHEGRILLRGKPRELVTSPEARRLYLGEGFRL